MPKTPNVDGGKLTRTILQILDEFQLELVDTRVGKHRVMKVRNQAGVVSTLTCSSSRPRGGRLELYLRKAAKIAAAKEE